MQRRPSETQRRSPEIDDDIKDLAGAEALRLVVVVVVLLLLFVAADDDTSHFGVDTFIFSAFIGPDDLNSVVINLLVGLCWRRRGSTILAYVTN